MWITSAPPPASASQAPPPPVWNPVTKQWDTVDAATGEIAPQGRARTISERVNAEHPVAAGADDFGPLPPQQDDDEFNAGPSSTW
jgi:hypothetical protein